MALVLPRLGDFQEVLARLFGGWLAQVAITADPRFVSLEMKCVLGARLGLTEEQSTGVGCGDLPAVVSPADD